VAIGNSHRISAPPDPRCRRSAKPARPSSTASGTKAGSACARRMMTAGSPARRWIGPLCSGCSRTSRRGGGAIRPAGSPRATTDFIGSQDEDSGVPGLSTPEVLIRLYRLKCENLAVAHWWWRTGSAVSGKTLICTAVHRQQRTHRLRCYGIPYCLMDCGLLVWLCQDGDLRRLRSSNVHPSQRGASRDNRRRID
jgi:hypothetical protein